MTKEYELTKKGKKELEKKQPQKAQTKMLQKADAGLNPYKSYEQKPQKAQTKDCIICNNKAKHEGAFCDKCFKDVQIYRTEAMKQIIKPDLKGDCLCKENPTGLCIGCVNKALWTETEQARQDERAKMFLALGNISVPNMSKYVWIPKIKWVELEAELKKVEDKK